MTKCIPVAEFVLQWLLVAHRNRDRVLPSPKPWSLPSCSWVPNGDSTYDSSYSCHSAGFEREAVCCKKSKQSINICVNLHQIAKTITNQLPWQHDGNVFATFLNSKVWKNMPFREILRSTLDYYSILFWVLFWHNNLWTFKRKSYNSRFILSMIKMATLDYEKF